MVNNDDFMTKYLEITSELAKLDVLRDIIGNEVSTTLKVGNRIEDENGRLSFFGSHYLRLVEELKQAGLIK